MLQAIRNKRNSTVIQIIVGIIVLVFIFWGFGADLLSGSRVPLTVNGEDVSLQEYNQAYNNAIDRLNQQFQGSLPKGFAEQIGLKHQVLNQLIRDTLLRQGARAMGIVVSNEEIRKAVAAMPVFQVDGRFNEERYKQVLANNSRRPMTPTVFEKQLRIDRLSIMAVNAVQGFATVSGRWGVENLYSQYNEKVKLQYAAFSPADYADKAVVDDSRLTAWFERHKEQYKTEPQSDLRYKTFLFHDVAEKVTVSDDEAKKYYDDYRNEFTIPEERTLATIQLTVTGNESEAELAEKRKKAEEIRGLALKQGADFAALAKEYSTGQTAAEGGDIGTITKGQIPLLDNAVFSLEKGGVSEIVTSPAGFNIFYVKDVKPGHTTPFAEAKEKIISTLRQKNARTLAFQLANNTYEGIIAAGSLKKYLAAHPETPFTDSGFITRSTAPAAVAEDPAFLKESFSLGKGELSSLVKGESGLAIFYTTDVKAPVVPPLADVRAKVEADWKRAESETLARSAAESLLKAAAKSDLAQAAQAAGVTLHESGEIGRNAQESGDAADKFPAALVGEAFKLTLAAPLSPAPLQDQSSGDLYAVQLSSRTRPTLPENAPDLEQYRSTLLQTQQQQLLEAWLQKLWGEADIRQNMKL